MICLHRSLIVLCFHDKGFEVVRRCSNLSTNSQEHPRATCTFMGGKKTNTGAAATVHLNCERCSVQELYRLESNSESIAVMASLGVAE